MIFWGPKNVDISMHKWFAWYPVKLNKNARIIDKSYKREDLPHYKRWVWLETVYRRRYISEIFETWVYQLLPDYDHPDFTQEPNNILKKML